MKSKIPFFRNSKQSIKFSGNTKMSPARARIFQLLDTKKRISNLHKSHDVLRYIIIFHELKVKDAHSCEREREQKQCKTHYFTANLYALGQSYV